ncbi:MAG TPA: hypothetical protein PLL30_10470 [Candidatus Krumholzibacteria bacterium]|nr:hypothetical protein [Candidatus Krumholzibacteria bacterium]HPD72186.1 hypothetical protein [Candidatus Krumholzibacteria bacterium]HRY40882.1 hypothetical protein [Candidatus Krumholzibacteria bacterium]
MRCCVLFLLAVPLLCTAALAVDPPEDLGYAVLGAYTEPRIYWHSQDYLEGVEAGVPFQVHFVMSYHRLPSQNLGGFECSWELLPAGLDYLVLDLEFGVLEAYNYGDEHDLLVGFRLPTSFYGQAIHLFTLTLMFTESPASASIRLQPSSIESIPGEMVYADYVTPEILLAMRPDNEGQSLDEPVFLINPAVAVETTTWSNVKAMFE